MCQLLINLIFIFIFNGIFLFENSLGENISKRQTPVVSGYRLPNTTRPLHYDLQISTRIDINDKNFYGDLTIQLEPIVETDVIVLNRALLTILKYSLQDENRREITITDTNIASNYKRQLLEFQLSSKLIVGKTYFLQIKYKGYLDIVSLYGFFRSAYNIYPSKKDRYIAVSHMQPNYARKIFPCYDEPAFKAKFTVYLKHSSKHFALSNMPVDRKTTIKSGMVLTKFKTSPKMSTYTLALCVSDLVNITFTKGNFTQRMFVQPKYQSAVDESLKLANDAVPALGEYFGIPFALPKLDHFASPSFPTYAGAMENYGLIIYGDGYVVMDSNKYSSRTADIICHEIVHQWFGNLVSPKWWTYTWLNEAFAVFYSTTVLLKIHPQHDPLSYYYKTYFDSGLLREDRPMTHYAEGLDLQKSFGKTVYSYASAVLRMWHHSIPEQTFLKGLKYYLLEKQFDVAVEEDLFRNLQRAVKEDRVVSDSGFDFTKYGTSWSQQAGIPLITVTRNYENNELHIEQEGFTGNKNALRWIPINVVSENHPDFNDTTAIVFMKNEKSITYKPRPNIDTWTSNDWIILNKQYTGFYRINYDKKNWDLIIAGAKKNINSIHYLNRKQILSDALILFQHNKLEFNTYKALLNLMKSKYLLKSESSLLDTIDNTFHTFRKCLDGNEEENLLKKFIGHYVREPFIEAGVLEKENDSESEIQSRNILIKWACYANIENCINETNVQTRQFLGTCSHTSSSWRKTIYCSAIQSQNDDIFQKLHLDLYSCPNIHDKYHILSALTCSNDPEKLKFLLSSANKSYRSSDDHIFRKMHLLNNMYTQTRAGINTAMEFLKENTISESPEHAQSHLYDVLSGIAMNIAEQPQYEMLKELFKSREVSLRLTPEEIAKIKDKAYAEVILNENMRKRLVEALRDFNSSNSASKYIVTTTNFILTLIIGLHFSYNRRIFI